LIAVACTQGYGRVAPNLWKALTLCVLLSQEAAGFSQPVTFYAVSRTGHPSNSKENSKALEPGGKKININHATLSELQTLPGVGPTLAQRILDYRKKNPPFRKVEELLIIRGISRDKLERMRSRISVQ
jgi:competence ComEA-like helix-hairpin-helix protein